jgi:hypothetical protein
MARGVPRPSPVKIEEIQGLQARLYCAALVNRVELLVSAHQ